MPPAGARQGSVSGASEGRGGGGATGSPHSPFKVQLLLILPVNALVGIADSKDVALRPEEPHNLELKDTRVLQLVNEHMADMANDLHGTRSPVWVACAEGSRKRRSVRASIAAPIAAHSRESGCAAFSQRQSADRHNRATFAPRAPADKGRAGGGGNEE